MARQPGIEEYHMENPIEKLNRIQPDFDFDDLIDLSDENGMAVSSIVREAAFEGTATNAGVKTVSLQSAMDNYARAMNKSAIAKSTGLPVRTPSQQYKGFIAEEYFKHTLKINALAKGVPDWKIGVYTNGILPDGSVLSGIDEHVDISVWTRKHPWSKPMRTVDYQSKIFNDASKYKKVFNDPKYQNVKHVGGAGQGVNETVEVPIGRRIHQSDSITPTDAVIRADQAKAQATPEYEKKQEKFDELNRINLGKAIAAGAATGFMVTTIQEIVSVIKNSKDLPEDQFVKSIEHILCGTVEGGIRSGAIVGSVQLLGKMVGREVAANSLEAIPGMVVANVAVDFAKDLYKCFVAKTIDTDDLLCNSVNNVFSSAAGFGGAWVAGQLGGQIAGQFSSQAFVQSVSIFASAKASAATGAAIGSSLGPIGTVIGSALGGLVIGIGANAIIGTANKDAIKAYTECIEEINTHIELSGCARVFYFADVMESLSDFKLSFKDLLPCYNLISDLKEYNLHKKALKAVGEQLEDYSAIDVEKQKALRQLEALHLARMNELREAFADQRAAMVDDFRESINTYAAASYMQYLDVYQVMQGNAESLLTELENRKTEHSAILEYMEHRNEINKHLNSLLNEIVSEGAIDELMPFIEKLTWFMNQDTLLVGRQYISFDEALYLVCGESII